MVIKYKCFDRSKNAWRTPDPENMVSLFTPSSNNAMRIVAPENYVLVIYTGFSDLDGNDVYPGDILDEERYIKWNILDGCFCVITKDGKEEPLKKFHPSAHRVTGNVLERDDWPSFEDVE